MHDIEQIYAVLLSRQYFKTLFSDIIGNSTIPSSGDFNVPCPLHKDPSPSFSISVDKPLFKCFGCSKQGDWLQYLQYKNGWTFLEALNYLAGEAGISEAVNIPKSEYKPREIAPKETRVLTYNERAENHFYWDDCHNHLLKNPAAQAFILKTRGITLDTIKSCGIGIDPIKRNWVFPINSVEQMIENSIGGLSPTMGGFELRKNDFSPFILNGKEAKCIKSKGSLNCLCSINERTWAMDSVIILEGFLDAYLYVQYLAEKGIKNVWVLSPSCGLSKLTEQISNYDFSSFEKVTIMLDNDFNHINEKGELENIGFLKMEELNALFPEFNYNCLPPGIKDFNQYYLEVFKKEGIERND